jgi:tetratricopeptide (TPR) repeat protein
LLRAVEICPAEPECHQVLAWLYERQGRINEAQAVLLRGCEANPEDVGVHLRLGAFFAEQRMYNEAEKAFRTAIRIMPYQGGGYAALAKLLLTSNRRLSEARQLAARAVELEPLSKHYFLLSLICQRLGDTAAARAAMEEAAERERADSSRVPAHELVQRGTAE